jgi:hypothetical protein
MAEQRDVDLEEFNNIFKKTIEDLSALEGQDFLRNLKVRSLTRKGLWVKKPRKSTKRDITPENLTFDDFSKEFLAVMKNKRKHAVEGNNKIIDLQASDKKAQGKGKEKKDYVAIGDLHSGYDNLLEILKKLPKDKRIVFMGDYAGRGDKPLQTLFTVFLLSTYHPDRFEMLPGNHETSEGIFQRDFPTRSIIEANKEIFGPDFSGTIYSCMEKVNQLFTLLEALPSAAKTEDTLFIHGAPYRGEIGYDILLDPNLPWLDYFAWRDIDFLEVTGIEAIDRKTKIPLMKLEDLQTVMNNLGIKYVCRGHCRMDPAMHTTGEGEDAVTIFTSHPHLPRGSEDLNNFKVMPAMSVAAFDLTEDDQRFLHNYTKVWLSVDQMATVHKIDQLFSFREKFLDEKDLKVLGQEKIGVLTEVSEAENPGEALTQFMKNYDEQKVSILEIDQLFSLIERFSDKKDLEALRWEKIDVLTKVLKTENPREELEQLVDKYKEKKDGILINFIEQQNSPITNLIIDTTRSRSSAVISKPPEKKTQQAKRREAQITKLKSMTEDYQAHLIKSLESQWNRLDLYWADNKLANLIGSGDSKKLEKIKKFDREAFIQVYVLILLRQKEKKENLENCQKEKDQLVESMENFFNIIFNFASNADLPDFKNMSIEEKIRQCLPKIKETESGKRNKDALETLEREFKKNLEQFNDIENIIEKAKQGDPVINKLRLTLEKMWIVHHGLILLRKDDVAAFEKHISQYERTLSERRGSKLAGFLGGFRNLLLRHEFGIEGKVYAKAAMASANRLL